MTRGVPFISSSFKRKQGLQGRKLQGCQITEAGVWHSSALLHLPPPSTPPPVCNLLDMPLKGDLIDPDSVIPPFLYFMNTYRVAFIRVPPENSSIDNHCNILSRILTTFSSAYYRSIANYTLRQFNNQDMPYYQIYLLIFLLLYFLEKNEFGLSQTIVEL